MRSAVIVMIILLAGCASKTPKQPPKCSGDFRPINVITPDSPEVSARENPETSKKVTC